MIETIYFGLFNLKQFKIRLEIKRVVFKFRITQKTEFLSKCAKTFNL